MTTLTDIAALRRAVRQSPRDLDARAILADALEEAGDPEGAFQRRLVAYARKVQAALLGRGPLGPKVLVGITDGPANVRVYGETLYGNERDGSRNLYAWVRKADGAVFIGSWKKPDGPVRFYLSDDAGAADRHVTPYGMARMS